MPPRFNRRGGIGIGVILIALGLVFLAGQFIPGVSWWQLWPLFIVLLGGIQIVTPDPRDGWGISRILDGVGTVLIGLVLLGNTTGFISWGVWLILLTLWPVLIIALGIALIGRALGQAWIRAISPLVIWAALAYAVATSLTGQGGYQPIAPIAYHGPTQEFNLTEPVGTVRSANLTFDGGAGDIAIGSQSGALITAKGNSPFGAPRLTVARADEHADIRLGLGDGQRAFVVPGFTPGQVDVGLLDTATWNLALNTGASSLNADLSRVNLSALTLKTGVSSVDVRLGRPAGSLLATGASGHIPVVVKAGVSSVTLRIPAGAEASIRASNGLSSLNIAPAFRPQVDGSWRTAGYGSASPSYDVQIESGVGSVSIQTY